MFVVNIENLKISNYVIFSKKHELFPLLVVSVVTNIKNFNREKESIKILKAFRSITNLEEYQKIYNDVCRKHKPSIQIEKYRLNKKLFH